MRSVPPNGKLPELVCEFLLEWEAGASSPSGARSGARARSAFRRARAQGLRFSDPGGREGGYFLRFSRFRPPRNGDFHCDQVTFSISGIRCRKSFINTMKMDRNFAGNHFWRRFGLSKTMVC